MFRGKPPSKPDPLAETAHLLGAVFGEQPEVTQSLQTVFRALERQDAKVVLELPWYKDGVRHQLVLQSRVGNRLVFHNPMKTVQAKPGTELTKGLRRRVEADGTESCDLALIESLFKSGKARAIISPK